MVATELLLVGKDLLNTFAKHNGRAVLQSIERFVTVRIVLPVILIHPSKSVTFSTVRLRR
jgi:hypothetical protein